MASEAGGEGILYTAIGEEFYEEAAASARRLHNLDVEYPTAIVTDQEPENPPFDHLLRVETPVRDRQDWLRIRLENLDRTPFERTLYLDTDTWVVEMEAVGDFFDLLDRFDLVTPKAFGRRLAVYREEDSSVLPTVEAPDAFPTHHAGIFAFVGTDAFRSLLDVWRSSFERHVEEWPELQNDQPALREAIFQTDIAIGTVAPEYCFRLGFPQYLMGPVKIIHGRAANVSEVASKVNSRTDGRVYYPIHTNNTHPDGRNMDVLLNPGRIERTFCILRQSVSEVGIARTALYTLAGGPVTGRQRTKAAVRSFREDGLLVTSRKIIDELAGV